MSISEDEAKALRDAGLTFETLSAQLTDALHRANEADLDVIATVERLDGLCRLELASLRADKEYLAAVAKAANERPDRIISMAREDISAAYELAKDAEAQIDTPKRALAEKNKEIRWLQESAIPRLRTQRDALAEKAARLDAIEAALNASFSAAVK